MIKSTTLFIAVTSTVLLCSCYVDNLPSTTAPVSSSGGDSFNSDAAVDPTVADEAGSGGNSTSEPSREPDEPDARIAVDGIDAGAIVNVESDGATVMDVFAEEDASDDDLDDASEVFGHRCDGVLCPSVTSPSQQCCTSQEDVDERRAQSADRCGIARLAIEGCTELEQMGALDDSCPSHQPTGAATEEPGCCTTEGRCGTFNVADAIGCHENESIDQACGQEEIDETQSCEPTGIYAVKAEIDLAWGGQSGPLFDITDDGRGISSIIYKITIERVDADNSFVAKAEPCGVELPLISNSAICESYLPTFPNEIWDRGTFPPVSVAGSIACLHPGCILSFNPASASVGIELEDEGSTWPSAEEATTVECPSGTGEDCYPDHDDDGYPGITVTLPNGETPASEDCESGYRMGAAPLSSNLAIIRDAVYRTDRLHLGVRVRLGASGQLTEDCGITDAVGIAEFVQSRAFGCMLEPESHGPYTERAGQNDLCDDEQLLFMNQNLPIYDILRLGQRPDWRLDLPNEKRVRSEGPRFQLIRIGDKDEDVSCPQVRDAF